jgi:hypothetical protein
MWIIEVLALEHSIDDVCRLMGDMGDSEQVMFAPLALAVIDSPDHGVNATGRQIGMPDDPWKIQRARFTPLPLAGR